MSTLEHSPSPVSYRTLVETGHLPEKQVPLANDCKLLSPTNWKDNA
jgi:hypothetical protein